MPNDADIVTSIVKDVLQATVAPRWASNGGFDSEARAIARQLPRIRSHQDATAAIQRVLASSFGDAISLSDRELDLAGRLFARRLRGVGLLAAPQTIEGFLSEEIGPRQRRPP